MYISTFYSFKGGVGRTMALVNVAVSLALRGRRVLVVDFDIEAPGLDTFDVLRPQNEVSGVIDFVTQYLGSGSAPDASDFIGPCAPIGEKGGGLWIMPSGKAETYSSNFKQLDWGELYERHDGFLLFEDLKQQWRELVKPDYVLIDSRTGHTDTSGICTRHLPDSVVVFFFPNEQNLRGLTEVVSDIRAEEKAPRNRAIDLHFVMSNVPDLDDEDQILEGKITAFRRQLSIRRKLMVVHRYDSLSLLNQVVFSKDRQRSRLAQEYENIVLEVSTRNPEDRDGALEYIRRSRYTRRLRYMRSDTAPAREKMLKKIEEAHPEDGEVLFLLSEVRDAESQPELAAALIDQSIAAGYDGPDAYLRRSRFRMTQENNVGAREDLRRVLGSDEADPPVVREAIGRLARLDDCVPGDIAASDAVQSLDLDDRLWIAEPLGRTRKEIEIAVALREDILETGELPVDRRNEARQELGLSYIGCGRFAEAAKMFREDGQELEDLDIRNAFNYGMAKWGEDKTVDAEILQRVVELDRCHDEEHEELNYLQCMAVAYWASGYSREGLVFLDKTRQVLGASRGRIEFSCWRYRQANSTEFSKDLDEIQDMMNGGEQLPRFLTG